MELDTVNMKSKDNRTDQARILVVSYHSTLPQNTGSNVRIRNLLQNFSRITADLLAPEPRDPDFTHFMVSPPRWTGWLQKIAPFNASIFGLHGQRIFTSAVRYDLGSRGYAAVQCEHLWSFPLAQKVARLLRVPLILVEHNIETVYVERLYDLRLYTAFVQRYEQKALNLSDRIVVCSPTDAAMLCTRFRVPQEKIWIVPNGVSLPQPAVDGELPLPRELHQRDLILFVGKTSYPPNRDAIAIIQKELAPRIVKKHPNALIVIAGGPATAAFDTAAAGYVFTGFVPSLDPLFRAARVCIAPLVSGSGTRLKILEYAAHGKAIVATSVAAEGIELADGRAVVIEDDWEGFAQAVASLIREPERADKLGRHAREVVSDRYTWDSLAAQLEAKIIELAQHCSAKHAEEFDQLAQ